MPNYLMTYHGGRQPESPEEGAANMERYKIWLAELGDAAVNPQSPIGKTHVVNKNGVSERSSQPMMGFSIIAAPDLNAVLEIAKACPFLDLDGSLEVSEIKGVG